jgi:hypothetical protein
MVAPRPVERAMAGRLDVAAIRLHVDLSTARGDRRRMAVSRRGRADVLILRDVVSGLLSSAAERTPAEP